VKRLLVLGVALVGLITVTAVAPASGTTRSRHCPRGRPDFERDPRGLLPLTADSVGASSIAAFRFTRPSDRPQVVSADLATDDPGRGAEAKFECGARVWRRTVVVEITLRAFRHSASLSERVVFVGRFRRGYRVWQVVH
jgi:hypothetical protein